MNATLRLIIGILLIGILGYGGYVGWQRIENGPNGNGNGFDLYGNVDVREVTLAFRVSGRLETVLAEEGDRVSAGDVVATLEKGDFRDQLAAARAKVESSAAALARMESGSRPEDVERARALVDQAEAAANYARENRDRLAALAERNTASHQAHDAAQAEFEEADAQLRAARAALTLAEIGPRAEDIRQARAALAGDRAALSMAERRLDDTELVAPSGGVILTRIREPGSIVAAGEPVLTLSLSDPVWVRAYVEEPYLGRVVPGMAVTVRTDGGGTYQGQIGFVSPTAEFTPKSVETRELRTSLVYRLRVIVQNPDDGLRQGMPVTVEFAPQAPGQ